MNIYETDSCQNIHHFPPIPIMMAVPMELEELEEVKRKKRSSYRGYGFPYYGSGNYDATKSFKVNYFIKNFIIFFKDFSIRFNILYRIVDLLFYRICLFIPSVESII